jgi:hypothetical protein
LAFSTLIILGLAIDMLMDADEIFDAVDERIELLVRQQRANFGPDGLAKTQVTEKYGEIANNYTGVRLFHGLSLK